MLEKEALQKQIKNQMEYDEMRNFGDDWQLPWEYCKIPDSKEKKQYKPLPF